MRCVCDSVWLFPLSISSYIFFSRFVWNQSFFVCICRIEFDSFFCARCSTSACMHACYIFFLCSRFFVFGYFLYTDTNVKHNQLKTTYSLAASSPVGKFDVFFAVKCSSSCSALLDRKINHYYNNRTSKKFNGYTAFYVTRSTVLMK